VISDGLFTRAGISERATNDLAKAVLLSKSVIDKASPEWNTCFAFRD